MLTDYILQEKGGMHDSVKFLMGLCRFNRAPHSWILQIHLQSWFSFEGGGFLKHHFKSLAKYTFLGTCGILVGLFW